MVGPSSMARCLEQLLPQIIIPNLFSFAKRQRFSMQDFLESMSLEDNFHAPLSP
jgi:hypothetical protein